MINKNKNIKLEFEACAELLKKYCAYQERCRFDVTMKAKKLGMNDKNIEKILQILHKEQFLNEERYVNSFVQGKLKNNKWGKLKIAAELKAKHINDELIANALNNIDYQTYFDVLKYILEKKLQTLADLSKSQQNFKLTQFAQSKGFEYDIIQSVIKEILRP